MLIKNWIYCIALFLSIFSIYTLKKTKENKNIYICKNIILISSIYIIYILLNLAMVGILDIPVQLDIIYINLSSLIAIILYAISIISNTIKLKKLSEYTKDKKNIIKTVILLTLPILLLSLNVLKDKYFIDKSNLIVVYKSNGNGGFGDGDTFGYAIGNDFCKQIDLGLEVWGSGLKKYLNNDITEIDNTEDLINKTKYKIIFEKTKEFSETNAIIYKDNNQICKVHNKGRYSNIDLKKAFYKEN